MEWNQRDAFAMKTSTLTIICTLVGLLLYVVGLEALALAILLTAFVNAVAFIIAVTAKD